MAAKTINGMMKAIERLHCVRKLWRCRAGWGMMFVREHAVPPEPPWGPPGSPHYQRNRRRRERWREERIRLTEENTVVFRYYPTLEACVKAEYRARVTREEGLPAS